MDKKKIIIPLLCLAVGIICILSSGLVNEYGVVPYPDKFIEIIPGDQTDSEILVVTAEDFTGHPEFLAVLENGGGVVEVYSSANIPAGGVSTTAANQFLSKYQKYSLSFNSDIYLIYVTYASYAMSTAEIIAAALKIFGWIPLLAGAVLMAVNFVRSFSSTAPESKEMQIQSYISEHPGCSAEDIRKNLGYSRGSTAHQIQKLVRDKRIAEKPYHKTVRYYPAEPQTLEKDRLDAACTKEKPSVILSALEKKTLSIAELSAETGISNASLRWHLSRLEEDGLVSIKKEGKIIRYSRKDRKA